MVKQLLISVFTASLFSSVNAYGQLKVGDTAPDFTFTDMNGNTQNLYTYLNQGKSVVLDVSATWCGPCWSYHKSKELEKFYTDEGPNGTKRGMVLFVEADKATTDADMKGTGSNTQGNWVSGTVYPMCNPSSGTPLSQFATGFKIPFYPTVYMICPDKKIALSPTMSKYTFTNAELKTAMNAKCKTTGVETMDDADSGLSVYPSLSDGTISLYSAHMNNVNVKVYNTVGALVYQTATPINNSPAEINLKNLPNGLYIVNVQSESNAVSKKIVINK